MTDSSLRNLLDLEVARQTDRLVEMTRRLLGAASPNPPSDTVEVATVAEALLRELPGIEVERVESAPRIVNLVARIRGRSPGRRLVFNGHLDTFPVGEELGWTVPPLGGVLAGGRLFGRGVSDMKGGLACSILAADLLARHRSAWSGEIVLTLAGDEENMGGLGTGWLLDHHPLAKGDAVICGDVGSPMVVRFGEKGLLWIEVEAAGRPAHGAHVHKGVNAIDRLRAALDQVKRLETLPVDAPPGVTAAILQAQEISEPLSGSGEAAVLGRVTVNIGTIAGGVSPNLIPSGAQAAADIRLPVGMTTSLLMSKLDEWLTPLEGVSWRAIRRFEPSFTPPTHEIVRCIATAATEVLGRAPAVNMRVGASDSRWYRMHGVPTVVFGPTPFNMGAADEYVLLDELVAVARVHTRAAYDFLTSAN